MPIKIPVPILPRYSDGDLIDLISHAEFTINRHINNGGTYLPERIQHFQKTRKFDSVTIGVDYSSAFENFWADIERDLNGRVYEPTARKIFNHWAAWALNEVNRSYQQQHPSETVQMLPESE